MAEPIDPGLAKKLDMFTAPPLPGGFADRALAAALALPEGEAEPAAPPLPRQRRPIQGRWWRRSAVGLGAIAAGMISISAAAMGYFGEPVRLAIHQAPVIGPMVDRVIERVIPEKPRRKAKLVNERAAPAKPAPAPAAIALPVEEARVAEPLPPRWRARAEVRRILADPEARKAWIEAHPEAAERIAARRAARIERRRTVQAEVRKRRAEAGIAPSAGSEVSPGDIVPQRPWRLERRERLRQWRERRRQTIEERLIQDDVAKPPEPQP